MATWPAALEIGEGATPNELDIDKALTSSQVKRFRDRDARLNDALQDGAAAPFDLNVNNVTVAGDLTVTGDINLTGNIDFPEKLLIYSNI